MIYDTLSPKAKELALWIMNDYEMHRKMVAGIHSLARHWVRWEYDPAKSNVLWLVLADCGAKAYAETFGFGREWNMVFSVLDLRQCAAYLERETRESVAEEAERIGTKKH